MYHSRFKPGERVSVSAPSHHGDGWADGMVGTTGQDMTDWDDDRIWYQVEVHFDNGRVGTIMDSNLTRV